MSDGPDGLVPITHTFCGGTAFLYFRQPQRGEVIEARLAVFPDGSRPHDGEVIVCASCHQSITHPGVELEWQRTISRSHL